MLTHEEIKIMSIEAVSRRRVGFGAGSAGPGPV